MNIGTILLTTDFIWISPVFPRMSFFFFSPSLQSQAPSSHLFSLSKGSPPVVAVPLSFLVFHDLDTCGDD